MSQTRAVYLMNNLTGAVGQLVGWNFRSFGQVQDQVFGFNEDGSYLLGGDDFDGSPISSYFEIFQDFGQTVRLRSMWIVGETAGNLSAIYTLNDRSSDQWTETVTPVLTELCEHGFKVPCQAHRDKGQFLRLRVANVAGCDFSIDRIHAVVIPLGTRREGK